MISTHFHITIAQSLLRTAVTHKMEVKVAADMEGLLNLSQQTTWKGLAQQLNFLAPDDAKKILHAAFHGKVQEVTLNLLFLLAEQHALQYLGKIAVVYRKNYHDAKGIKEITIRTAREFSPQEQLAFVQKLQAKKNGPVTVKFEVDAKLIAGAQIYENSYVTDYSVKNYLETLQKHLTNQQLS